MDRKKIGITLAALCMLMLILDSRAAAEAASAAVDACIRTVIPALFPFFLLSGYLTGSIGSGRLFRKTARLFHSPKNCGGILLCGFLGGYPLGAKLVSEAYRTGQISRREADRMLMFCSQAGPAFLFGIAAAQLHGALSGWALWITQLVSALAVARLFPTQADDISAPIRTGTVKWNDLMRSSVTAIGSVCGWVVAFSVIKHFLQRWVLWLLPETVRILLCGMLELTSGCLMLSAVENLSLRFLLAVVMLNFGGLCVVMQTASVAGELDLRQYLLGKVIQTLFAILFALILLGHFTFLISLILIFYIKIAGIFGKRGSILRKASV